jgi:hypothetical protein
VFWLRIGVFACLGKGLIVIFEDFAKISTL